MSGLLLAIAGFTALLGSACLALGQARHWTTVMGEPRGSLTAPRAVGWVLVTASLVVCVARDGGSFGALLWPMLLAASGMLTAGTLTWKPDWFRRLAELLDRTFAKTEDA